MHILLNQLKLGMDLNYFELASDLKIIQFKKCWEQDSL